MNAQPQRKTTSSESRSEIVRRGMGHIKTSVAINSTKPIDQQPILDAVPATFRYLEHFHLRRLISDIPQKMHNSFVAV